MYSSAQNPSQADVEVTHLELEGGSKPANLPWLSDDVVEARRIDLGLTNAEVSDFIESCEFVGLGSYCGVSRALQCLGLKRYSYPFDWVRTSVRCTALCLQRNFKGFCTWSFVGEVVNSGVMCRGGAQWGGSFWHHDPDDPRVQADFERRICRLKGQLEVPGDVARVFCISLNSLSDMEHIPLLRLLLQAMLPSATVYLIVFIDGQLRIGPVIVDGDDYTMFYRIGAELFAPGQFSDRWHAEIYAKGIAIALRFWIGQDSRVPVEEVESLTHLFLLCSNFDAGNPAEAQFVPVQRPPIQPPLFSAQKYQSPPIAKFENLPWPLSLFECGCDSSNCDTDKVTYYDYEAIHEAGWETKHSEGVVEW